MRPSEVHVRAIWLVLIRRSDAIEDLKPILVDSGNVANVALRRRR